MFVLLCVISAAFCASYSKISEFIFSEQQCEQLFVLLVALRLWLIIAPILCDPGSVGNLYALLIGRFTRQHVDVGASTSSGQNQHTSTSHQLMAEHDDGRDLMTLMVSCHVLHVDAFILLFNVNTVLLTYCLCPAIHKMNVVKHLSTFATKHQIF